MAKPTTTGTGKSAGARKTPVKKKPATTGRALAVTKGKGKKTGLKKQGYA